MKNLISEGEDKACNVYIVRVSAFVIVVFLAVVGIYGALEQVNKGGGSQKLVLSKGNYAPTARLLLTSTTGATLMRRILAGLNDNGEDDGDDNSNDGNDGSMNRVGMGTQCSKDNILVFQGPTSPLPNGIPTYTVEIENVCLLENCSISDIHMSCGWFSSARMVDPRIFRRIGYDDCLVNDGEPLNPGEALSFQYANTYEYPLSVSSVSC